MNKKERHPSLRIPLDLTDSQHLCCSIHIKGIPAYFLIDTGASHSCFSKQKSEVYGIVCSEEMIQASAANPTPMEAQKSEGVSLSFDSKSLSLSFMVMDFDPINQSLANFDVPAVDGILGADFLIQTQAIVNYAELSLELQF